jgi:reverse transcriptase-like protein
VSEPKLKAKPFVISKRVVWEAYKRVKANQGAAGVDGESIEEFEADLQGNLYKLWNRLSSGSYFPPPVRAVEIPKQDGRMRVLGVPTVADRVAQTVVALYLEPGVEPVFHPDSYGYRPGRSALEAVAVCRQRCWRNDWVIDLDIRSFFDSLDPTLVLRVVSRHTDRGGSSSTWSGGCPRRCKGRTAACRHAIVAPRRGLRSRLCWQTSSCTTRSISGSRGSSRMSPSSATRMMLSSTAGANAKRASLSLRSRTG